MIRRLLFVIALSFSFQWVAAQTITDDQVVKMILAEKESGADEETIARIEGLTMEKVMDAAHRTLSCKPCIAMVGKGAETVKL